MRRRLRILLTVLTVFAVLGVVAWLTLRPRDPLFHGRRESEWIKSIEYSGSDAQTQQWRDFGPDGAKLLGRSLDQGRRYRKTYRWLMPRLPGFINRTLYNRLPKPQDAHPTRMCVISLLSSLGKDAKPAEPAIARALDDDDSGVRLGALGCYESGLLEIIGEQEKTARLPAFLRAMQDSDGDIRNNAVVALRFYTDQAVIVVPVLVKALQDSNIHVRLLAAGALAHMDVQAAIHAGVIPLLVNILKDPDDQVAYRAAEFLGDLGKEATPAVPALIEAVQGTNRLVAATAATALRKINPEAAPKHR